MKSSVDSRLWQRHTCLLQMVLICWTGLCSLAYRPSVITELSSQLMLVIQRCDPCLWWFYSGFSASSQLLSSCWTATETSRSIWSLRWWSSETHLEHTWNTPVPNIMDPELGLLWRTLSTTITRLQIRHLKGMTSCSPEAEGPGGSWCRGWRGCGMEVGCGRTLGGSSPDRAARLDDGPGFSAAPTPAMAGSASRMKRARASARSPSPARSSASEITVYRLKTITFSYRFCSPEAAFIRNFRPNSWFWRRHEPLMTSLTLWRQSRGGEAERWEGRWEATLRGRETCGGRVLSSF